MNQANVPIISNRQIKELVAYMNRVGFGIVPDYVAPNQLESLQRWVREAVVRAGDQYVAFTGQEAVAGTFLETLSAAPAFIELLHQLYEQGCGQPAPRQTIYQVLRCLKGPSGLKHAFRFHYDSYVVTALLPIIIPSWGETGALIMAPNRRPIRKTYLANLADKIMLDNPLSQRALRAGILRLQRIELVPGNLYLFWGYRSVHANERCDPERLRATGLFHFGDPHLGSGLRHFTGRAKERAGALP